MFPTTHNIFFGIIICFIAIAYDNMFIIYGYISAFQ